MILEIDVRLARGSFQLQVRQRLEGSVHGLFGPSGSGKTTLLNIVAGLVRPDSGRVIVDGETLFDAERGINLPPFRRRIGVVFQEDRLFPHLSVRQNLTYGEPRSAGGASGWTLQRIAGLLQISALLDKKPMLLSGGEKQRVALARAILSAPRLLLLDEPLSSLDSALKREILPVLRTVRDVAGIPMIYVSHDLAEVLDLTPRLALLDGGRITGNGVLADLIQDPVALRVLRTPGLVNVLRLRLLHTDTAEGISGFAVAAGNDVNGEYPDVTIFGPPIDAEPGVEVHATLRPEDIALATVPPKGISIQNRIEGRIQKLVTQDNGVLCLVAGPAKLLVELSPHAVRQLNLSEGTKVYCLFKAFAVRYLDKPTGTGEAVKKPRSGPGGAVRE